MTSNIISVVNNNNGGVTVAYSITDDALVVTNYGMDFPMPLTSTAVADLTNTITAEILKQLNLKFVGYIQNLITNKNVAQVSSNLVGKTQTVSSTTVNGVNLDTKGTV